MGKSLVMQLAWQVQVVRVHSFTVRLPPRWFPSHSGRGFMKCVSRATDTPLVYLCPCGRSRLPSFLSFVSLFSFSPPPPQLCFIYLTPTTPADSQTDTAHFNQMLKRNCSSGRGGGGRQKAEGRVREILGSDSCRCLSIQQHWK